MVTSYLTNTIHTGC
ncbi:hypothetical protein ACHAXS_004535 [Conticribra weissflogii]